MSLSITEQQKQTIYVQDRELQRLPPELVLQIFSYLPLSPVCLNKKLRILWETTDFWKPYAERIALRMTSSPGAVWCLAPLVKIPPFKTDKDRREFAALIVRAPDIPASENWRVFVSLINAWANNFIFAIATDPWQQRKNLLDKQQPSELCFPLNHPTIMTAAVRKYSISILENAAPSLKSNRKLMLEILRSHGEALEHAAEELRDDEELVMAAVRNNGKALKYASTRLRNNQTVVWSAVMQAGRFALPFTTSELQTNEDTRLVLGLFSKYYYEDDFQKASPGLRAHQDAMMAAVKADGRALKYVSERLLKDKEILKEALSQNANAFQYVDPDLRISKEFMLEALSYNGEVLQYAPPDLCDEKEILMKKVSWRRGRALQYVSERLRDDEEIVKIAVQYQGHNLQYASERLRNDEEIVKIAVQCWGDALKHASESLRDNEEIVKIAVQHLQGQALQHASERLRDDREFAIEVVRDKRAAFDYLSERLQKDPIVRAAAWR